jgi:protein gp37
MGERSVIEWTDSTWNPWRGCDKVSPGCAHCYMFRDMRRYGRDPEVVTRCADGTFYAPIRKAAWARERDAAIADHGRHFVFTCSWSDWFHPAADEWRDEAWEIIRRTPQSTYQILTKRPELIADRLPDDWGEGYPNVWLGVTIENRRFVDRADLLRVIPAAVRFISAEPLLGPLVPTRFTDDGWYLWPDGFSRKHGLLLYGIDWLITGGESGPGHRRFDSDWALDLRDHCAERGVAFLHKQNGGPRPDSNGRLLDGRTYTEFPTQPERQAHV